MCQNIRSSSILDNNIILKKIDGNKVACSGIFLIEGKVLQGLRLNLFKPAHVPKKV